MEIYQDRAMNLDLKVHRKTMSKLPIICMLIPSLKYFALTN